MAFTSFLPVGMRASDQAVTLTTPLKIHTEYPLRRDPPTPPQDSPIDPRQLLDDFQHGHQLPRESKLAGTTVAVIGVGYVGLHLVMAFSKEYSVIAYDVDQARLNEVASCLKGQNVYCTSDSQKLAGATHFLVAVNTGLYHDKSVDDRALRKALDTVAHHATPQSTVVIESSVAVGTTRAILGPLMRAKGFKAGMSPEVSLKIQSIERDKY
jgi:hypothetical protein